MIDFQLVLRRTGEAVEDIVEDVVDAVTGENHQHHSEGHEKLEEQSTSTLIHDKATVTPVSYLPVHEISATNRDSKPPISEVKTTPIVVSVRHGHRNGHTVGHAETNGHGEAKSNGHAHGKGIDIKGEVKSNGDAHVKSSKKAVAVGDIKGATI